MDCPEDLKFFLRCETNLHRVVRTIYTLCPLYSVELTNVQAIGIDGQRVDGPRATDFIIRSGGNCSFVAGDVMNQVIRSRYGQRLAQNSTREIWNPRCFTILAGMRR